MQAVREFFLTEAGECLDALDDVVQRANASGVDASELLRWARTLRGSAQMAREERVHAVALTLESVGRALVSRVVDWDAELVEDLAATVEDLRALAMASEGGEEADARVGRALDRWRRPGIQVAEAPVRPEDGAEPSAAPAADASAEFLAFAAREAQGIRAELDAALPSLAAEPRGREPLKAIMRRQRALLGANQLDRVPAVAEALRAVDEVTRLVARLDVPVEGEWLELYRGAREVLAEAEPALMRGEAPAETPALAGVRAGRAAILERHATEAEPRAAPQVAEEAPVEVVNFFRTEARTLVDRIERMATDLDAAAADRAAGLRRELRAALSALRDTADTFGFAEAGRLAQEMLDRAASGSAAELLATVPRLRDVVTAGRAAAGEAEGDAHGAASASPAAASDPAATAGEAGGGETVAAPPIDPAPAAEPTAPPAAQAPPLAGEPAEPTAGQGTDTPDVPDAPVEPPERADAPPAATTEPPADPTGPSTAPTGPVAPPIQPPAAPTDPATPPTAPDGVPTGAGTTPVAQPAGLDGVVPIESLLYQGEDALRRALALRTALERAVAGDAAARETLDEVFDLIRLGLS